jgi:hypothetical protein
MQEDRGPFELKEEERECVTAASSRGLGWAAVVFFFGLACRTESAQGNHSSRLDPQKKGLRLACLRARVAKTLPIFGEGEPACEPGMRKTWLVQRPHQLARELIGFGSGSGSVQRAFSRSRSMSTTFARKNGRVCFARVQVFSKSTISRIGGSSRHNG